MQELQGGLVITLPISLQTARSDSLQLLSPTLVSPLPQQEKPDKSRRRTFRLRWQERLVAQQKRDPNRSREDGLPLGKQLELMIAQIMHTSIISHLDHLYTPSAAWFGWLWRPRSWWFTSSSRGLSFLWGFRGMSGSIFLWLRLFGVRLSVRSWVGIDVRSNFLFLCSLDCLFPLLCRCCLPANARNSTSILRW